LKRLNNQHLLQLKRLNSPHNLKKLNNSLLQPKKQKRKPKRKLKRRPKRKLKFLKKKTSSSQYSPKSR
jgi:hypothetical protein